MSANFTTTITVNATPQEAFDAISDVSGWWGRITGTSTSVGDEFVYLVPGLHYAGFRVTELEPGRRIAWLVTGSYLDMIADKQEWNGTTVRFDIAEDNDGTLVTFTHEGLEPDLECYGLCSNAWSTYVRGSLKSFLDTGRGQPNSFQGDEALDAAAHAELRRMTEGTPAGASATRTA